MKIILRCTKIKNKPDVTAFKQHDPQIEQCEACKEDVWECSPARIMRRELGQDKFLLLCNECADEELIERFKNGAKGAMHFNALTNKVTTIEVI